MSRLISWTRYDFNIENYADGTSDTISLVSNEQLPTNLVLEIKYGMESINYPTLWSERMTVSALWDVLTRDNTSNIRMRSA
jgi:hypothetical protein